MLKNLNSFFKQIAFVFQNFSNSFYGLFDQYGVNALDQTEWFEMLKLNAR